MNNISSCCIRASDLVVSEIIMALSGLRSLDVFLNIAPIASTTTGEIDIIRDPQPGLMLPHNSTSISRMVLWFLLFVLSAWVGPVCHTGYGEHNRDRNGPERSAGGGCNPGMHAFGAPDPLEMGSSPSQPFGSKRKRNRGPSQPSKASSKKQTARRFACPFYLRDRIRHSACLNVRLARLSDVRQHLLDRAHNQVVHCPVCGTTFTGRTTEARQQRDQHVQAAACEPSPSPFNYPGITEDQEQEIREIARNARSSIAYTEAQRWYMIWGVLFPGAPHPNSPFLSDVPDIQRVVDWTDVVFESDLWQRLPNQPWTTTMRREEQRSGMSNFIHSFIDQARGIVEQNVGPIEDDHGVDQFSNIGPSTPGPSGATADPGMASLASFDFNPPVHTSGRAYLSPVSATRSRQSRNSHRLGQIEHNPGELPAGAAAIPFHLQNNPTMNVTQDTQQHGTTGPGTGMQYLTVSPQSLWESPGQDFPGQDFQGQDFPGQEFPGQDIPSDGGLYYEQFLSDDDGRQDDRYGEI